jgi:hypothetical protein
MTLHDHQRPLFDDVSDDRGHLMIGLVTLVTFAGIWTIVSAIAGAWLLCSC